ncbi:hypothetical protein NGA_0442400 [Nannochloropsis gaditana CCMP526]|uniref:uncharacterized protein n=1 Tax=Nannochloropsis gaditana (strain CCMP526) TaxID=1093141 RepID=UPI00029F5B76|nr:hypothetical protein NGA_0442400 [Nannochloropsis gaditana CCMP526]EKU22335.1 hypothetical protein NGA_0442400 [Nannochloropsis gaditana CCMP526]|eukprot:XP_005854025.1 hypothetical protein NGA_0442400 [Nannochloropsis gaditana CCMP526]
MMKVSWNLHVAKTGISAMPLKVDPKVVPVIYDGPKAEGGEVKREVGAILEEYMLALEVGPSTLLPDERGLYIRLIGKDVEEATVEWGSILCGYGEGSMEPSPGEGDKSVLFSLPSAEAAVFYNKELVPIFEVLADLPDGTGLQGYFVPKAGLPAKAAFIGLFANDLAIGGPSAPATKEEYEEASDQKNIAALALGYFQKQGADGGRVEVRLALLGGHGGEIQKLNQ